MKLSPVLQQQHDRAIAVADERARKRLSPPLVRLWDGDWNCRSVVAGEISGSAKRVSNAPGSIELVLPWGHHLRDWLLSQRKQAARKNVHVTVDKDGARISGRLAKLIVSKTERGERQLRLLFADDIEELDHIRLWANPVLPAAIQFPRAFTLGGPAIWTLKTSLFLNLMRLQNSLFTVPDNPLDFSSWGANLGMENWPIVVRGGSILGDSSPFAIVNSRMKSFLDVAKPILEDAQLEITYRRYLPGDPDPWPGHHPHVGQLVFDIVDKSGWWGATGTRGNILDGIWRTVLELGDDFAGSDHSTVVDPNFRPPLQNNLFPQPDAPWVVYREGDITGIESSEYTWEPATDTNLILGGKSMPGVNEAISSAIQLAGDLASTTFIGPNVNAGQIADTFLKPLYEDTILAWVSYKDHPRAMAQGWSHYFEHMPQNTDSAYTISTLLAIRKALWDTRERTGHKVDVGDGRPYLIGDNGEGHFWVGDRIAVPVPGDSSGELLVDRVTQAEYSWSRTDAGWSVTVGSLQSTQSPDERVIGHVKTVVEAAKELGVL